jgi:tRNA (cmo5U34)-methyltransferase
MIERLIPCDKDEDFVFVDLGCGTGTLSARLLERFPNSRGLAVDGEQAMLTMAQPKLARFAGRAELRLCDIVGAGIPTCKVVISSFSFHHVPPEAMDGVLKRVVAALRPEGCFLLLDHMWMEPRWGARVGELSREVLRRHCEQAVASGCTTQTEIEERLAFKRRMKEAGRDVEYMHRVEDFLDWMRTAGFADTGVVWRMFSSTT